MLSPNSDSSTEVNESVNDFLVTASAAAIVNSLELSIAEIGALNIVSRQVIKLQPLARTGRHRPDVPHGDHRGLAHQQAQAEEETLLPK